MNRIRIDGAVAAPTAVSADELRSRATDELVFDFTCLEGWCHPGTRWSGARLTRLVEPLGPEPDAGFIEVASGEYVATLPREAALAGGLLAVANAGVLLDEDSGGPVRFVMAGVDCFANVKGVDRISFVMSAGGDTARTIALGRIGQGAGTAQKPK